MKELYEIGVVIRGFVMVNYKFREIPKSHKKETDDDLRGAFISAINTFAKQAFVNTAIEYLELENFLFIFKIKEIKASDCNKTEPFIMYGLTERKKKPDKYVERFFEKIEPIMQYFITSYSDSDFTELSKFEPFKEELKEFFS